MRKRIVDWEEKRRGGGEGKRGRGTEEGRKDWKIGRGRRGGKNRREGRGRR